MSQIASKAARLVAGLPPDWELRFQRCYTLLTAAAEWQIPITRLHGTSRSGGNPATLLVAGEGPGTEYLSRCFFTDEPRREPVGAAPVWAMEDRLEALGSEAVLTIAQLDHLPAHLFFHRGWLVVPGWVEMILRVPRDPGRLTRSCSSVIRDMQILRNENFEARVSTGDSDVESFYREFYVPTTIRRHRDPTFVRDEYWLRQRARRGGVIWIQERGRRLGGMLFERRRDQLGLWAMGILGGDPVLMQRRVVAAVYWQCIQYASRLGYATIDFGSVRPSLNDGLLRYKRKWGAALVNESRTHYDLLVGWREWNATIAAFLAETPLIFRWKDRLHGIGAIPETGAGTQAEAARSRHLLWTDGLADLTLVSGAGWEKGVSAPDRTRLVSGPCTAAEVMPA